MNTNGAAPGPTPNLSTDQSDCTLRLVPVVLRTPMYKEKIRGKRNTRTGTKWRCRLVNSLIAIDSAVIKKDFTNHYFNATSVC